MLRFNLRKPIFQNFPGACPSPPRVRHAKACLAILHTAASLSVLQLLYPTTNGELQSPLIVMFLYAILQTEETIIMHINLTAYFTTLIHSKIFKNSVLDFSAKHCYQNGNMTIPMSPSL